MAGAVHSYQTEKPPHLGLCQLSTRCCGNVVWPWLSSFESPAHPVKSLASTCPAPGAHSSSAANACLFDHLVGAGEQGRRHIEAERTRRRQVDDEVELVYLHHRQVGGLFAFKNARRIDCKLSISLWYARPVAHKAAVFHIRPHCVNCRNGMACRQRDNLHITAGEQCVRRYHKRVGFIASERGEG